MYDHRRARAYSAKGVSYRDYLSPNSPWFGLAEFWSLERSAKRPLNRKLVKTLCLGIASGLLYFFLFEYEGELRHLEQLTRDGEKIDFLVPIIVALVFSVVHGAFTGHFWELLGLKPKSSRHGPQAMKESSDGAA